MNIRHGGWIWFAVFSWLRILAQEPAPLDTLRARDREIHEILHSSPELSAEARDRIQKLLDLCFDYPAHVRLCFGKQWPGFSPAQQREAVAAVTAILRHSSLEKVLEFQTEQVEYAGQRIQPDSRQASVQTRVTRGAETWEIEYVMHRSGGQWRIVDVVIEGASSVENNRAAFMKEIRAGGVDGLLAKLRRRAAEVGP